MIVVGSLAILASVVPPPEAAAVLVICPVNPAGGFTVTRIWGVVVPGFTTPLYVQIAPEHVQPVPARENENPAGRLSVTDIGAVVGVAATAFDTVMP